MNKQKFIEFLQNPGKLTEQNLRDLDDLVNENPYFQAARVLEAKGNRTLKTKEAGKKTASAAIYSTNRLLLKKYLDSGFTSRPAATASAIDAAKEKTIPAKTPSSPPKISATSQPTQDTIETASSGGSSIDQLIYSLKQDMKELEESRAKYIEVTRKIEEDEAVEKAVKKATKSTVSKPKPAANKSEEKSPPKTTKKKATPKKSATASKTSTSASKTKKPRTSAAKSTVATRKKATGKTGTTTKSTSGKKKTTAKKTTSKKSPSVKKTTTKARTTKTTATRTTAKKSTPRASRSTKNQKTTKKNDNDGANHQQLIDEFIKKNPSFKPATSSTNQEDLSAKSTSLNDDIASEYLAEIFLEQGKKDQAIKIYNSLMLRFPEKSTYFAGRIKKIK